MSAKQSLQSKSTKYSDTPYMKPDIDGFDELRKKQKMEKPGLPLITNEESIRRSIKAGNRIPE